MNITTNPKPGSPTILVVDDEPDVLRLVDAILRNQGYQVVTAKGADQALTTFAKMARKPDLVLTDVVMPGMSGPMMVDQLRQTDPNVKVLFMSGYDDRHVVQRYVVEQGFSLIPKPFTLQTLGASVKEALDAIRREDFLEPAK